MEGASGDGENTVAESSTDETIKKRQQWRACTVEKRYRSALLAHNAAQRVIDAQKNRRRATWWIPSSARTKYVDSSEERESAVCDRMLKMLRRATLEHYFSAAQFSHILNIVPHEHSPDGVSQAIITLWGRTLDAEQIDVHSLFDSASVDTNADGMIMFYELGKDTSSEPAALLQRRLGSANIFNPFKPDRAMYMLDLGQPDDLKVARMLVRIAFSFCLCSARCACTVHSAAALAETLCCADGLSQSGKW